MLYWLGAAAIVALIVLIRTVLYKRKLKNLIKNDPRYRYLDTPEDKVLLDCPDCTCTTHYIKTKAGIKRIFCYDDFIWVYIFYQKYLTRYSFGLTLMAYTKDGKRYKIMNAAGAGRKMIRLFENVINIIQEHNSECMVGETEENHQKYRKMMKY